MLMSLYRSTDRDAVQFDFLVQEREAVYAFEKEIESLGGRVYKSPKFALPTIFSYIKYFSNLIEQHPEWRVVHFHYLSSSIAAFPVVNIKGRQLIAHAHTAGMVCGFKSLVRALTQMPARFLSHHLFACSTGAANWMFGSKSKDAIVLNNAIDVDSFLPDETVRKRVREEMGLGPGQKVIGHVGRFMEVKNHTFMLDVLQALVKKDPEVAMVLVGDGPLKEHILEQAERMDVADNVVFTGVRSDISDLMQAMDAFIFPSFHEGLPVTLVEAQASGLACLVSDTVSQDVKLTDCIEFMSLNASADRWAERLLDMCAQGKRPDNRHELSAAGYDVKDNARWLENFYHKITESA